MRMEYLAAEATLATAEKQAWQAKDFDTLARLLLPLQEARRQRRQRCGEGIICLDIIADRPDANIDSEQIVRDFPHGQLLIAGWKSLDPSLRARRLQAEHGLYLDVFLAMRSSLSPECREMENILLCGLPDIPPVLELPIAELPRGRRVGNAETYALTMSIWERLHAPFLAAADAEIDPLKKINGYRTAIEVDYACELAHQRMAEVIRKM